MSGAPRAQEEVLMNDEDRVPDAIRDAQAERGEAVAAADTARAAVVEFVETKNTVSIVEVIERVSEDEALSPETVQRVIWGLVHDKDLNLTDEFLLSSNEPSEPVVLD